MNIHIKNFNTYVLESSQNTIPQFVYVPTSSKNINTIKSKGIDTNDKVVDYNLYRSKDDAIIHMKTIPGESNLLRIEIKNDITPIIIDFNNPNNYTEFKTSVIITPVRVFILDDNKEWCIIV